MVKSIINLKKKLNQVKLKDEQDMINRQIDALKLQIDELLYDLYGITKDKEKKIIEDSLK